MNKHGWSGIGRRALIAGSVAAAALPSAQAAAKYRRYNVTSVEGKKELASYAKGLRAMLQLPVRHPHNWFRNAFVHFMDCPHGNWWFYVWHRGYVGHLEQTIRKLSGDPDFAFPFWDWSVLPRIPAQMFDGVLTPTDSAYLPFTRDVATFTSFVQRALKEYWGSLTKEQLADQAARGVDSFDDLWAGVTGAGVPGNAAFAATARSRYLTRQNPGFDKATTYDCSRPVVLGGVGATSFYADGASIALSFNSVRTASHVDQPNGQTWFSVLEGLPHNNTHNWIGGVGPWDPGPYGNMSNFLSPIDPIFFLHHANLDRLWDVWTRKQQALALEYRPGSADTQSYMDERFRFFVDSDRKYLTDARAQDYFSMDAFNYDYAKGTGDELIPAAGTSAQVAAAPSPRAPVAATMSGNVGTLALPQEAPQTRLVAAVTFQPSATGSGRAFDVLVNAPEGAPAGPDSRFFAGRVAFFGPAMHHAQGGAATFLVPLLQNGTGVGLASSLVVRGGPMRITVVPAGGKGAAPSVRSITVHAL